MKRTDIISGWVLHGAKYLRTGKEGIVPIIQDIAS